ncbi:hypothetical protein [Saccharopolyspora phatthalungensis]|uniref:Uncharacterized protein n=1 Tax=Saccharopolyspora phatthalungensis TaxID=664693 RepID=A0A840Q9I3_9PSEU|nr:hypothetical protein [Saccharopolyspora phatthalungensis]MBB5157096.1 hypothetical protein [Saccharopolyspora phatthalungensis]
MTATTERPEQRADAPDASSGESAQQPASTSNAAEHNKGVQSGTFNGNYNVYNWYAESRKPQLDDRRISDEEIVRAREHFVERPGFGEALATLRRNRLLFLLGKGAGRSLASIRLLDECAVRSISRLSERRSFDSLAGADLEPGCGYIWEGLDTEWQDEITPASVDRATAWATKHNCFVVVIVDYAVSSDLRKYAERLGRPNPVDVALAVLRSQLGLNPDRAEEVLDSDFRERLPGDSAPNDAEFVAIRAWEVDTGKRNKAEALEEASQDLRKSVTSWFRLDRSPIEYAMLVAISVFENRDYDDVIASAEELENMIYQQDQGKSVASRKIFEFSKTRILFSLSATITPHRHTDGRGLHKETVHFRRSGWAQEAFRRAWSEYDLLRPVVVDWMAKQAKNGFQWYCAKALHDVLVNVPHSNPVAHVDALAGKQSPDANELAAELLGRLAGDPQTRHVVAPTLREWCASSRDFHRKWTAALVYATDYGLRQPEVALQELEKIARTNANLNSAVGKGIISLLDEPANRALVLRALQQWTRPDAADLDDDEQRANLRAVGLDCAQAALGLAHDTSYLRSLRASDAFGDPDPRPVAKLFRRLFQDERTRDKSLHTLLDLSDDSADNPTSDEARGLAQLVFTVAPDLHRTTAHPLFEHWKKIFPGNARRIDRAFTTLQLLHQMYSPHPER